MFKVGLQKWQTRIELQGRRIDLRRQCPTAALELMRHLTIEVYPVKDADDHREGQRS
jgi:hypothetical protein